MTDLPKPRAGRGEVELCQQCGHPFDDHQLFGKLPAPNSGWMTCPVAGCACRMTWSMAEPQPPGDGTQSHE